MNKHLNSKQLSTNDFDYLIGFDLTSYTYIRHLWDGFNINKRTIVCYCSVFLYHCFNLNSCSVFVVGTWAHPILLQKYFWSYCVVRNTLKWLTNTLLNNFPFHIRSIWNPWVSIMDPTEIWTNIFFKYIFSQSPSVATNIWIVRCVHKHRKNAAPHMSLWQLCRERVTRRVSHTRVPIWWARDNNDSFAFLCVDWHVRAKGIEQMFSFVFHYMYNWFRFSKIYEW